MLFVIDWLQKKAEGAKKEFLTEPKSAVKETQKERHPKRKVKNWNC